MVYSGVFPPTTPLFSLLTCASFTLRRVGWILTCDTTTAVQSFCETICDRCDWHLTETQPQSQLHNKRCWLIDAVALFRFCHFQFYSGIITFTWLFNYILLQHFYTRTFEFISKAGRLGWSCLLRTKWAERVWVGLTKRTTQLQIRLRLRLEN